MGSLVVDLGLDQLGLGEKDHNKEIYRTNMFKNKFAYSCKWKKNGKKIQIRKLWCYLVVGLDLVVAGLEVEVEVRENLACALEG